MIELIPQGTLVEKIRNGGAGIPLFTTRTGLNTFYSEGQIPLKFDSQGKRLNFPPKKQRVVADDGLEYLLEESLVADVGLIKAHIADTQGNLVYNKTAQNSNAAIAKACKFVIAEVDEIVPVGSLDPNTI